MNVNISHDIKQAAQEHLVAFLLVALCVLQVLSLSLFLNWTVADDASDIGGEMEGLVRVEKLQEFSEIPKLSSIRGPQITDEAAMVIATAEGETIPVRACDTLPVRLWVFLLIAYLALLVFNLAAGFGRRTTLQWFWEATYTGLALLAWPVWDGCGSAAWYPLAVMQMGILVYLLYLYFFEHRMRRIDYEHADEPVW